VHSINHRNLPKSAGINAVCSLICSCFCAFAFIFNSLAFAQESAVVAVDDSPAAEQMLSQAEDQAANNPAESARLISRVLEEFGRKLVRVSGEQDRFVDGRSRAESFLRSHPQVMAKFRSAQTGEAERLIAAGEDRKVVETRLLTSGGLLAAVRETQRSIELAQFASAQNLLDSIKDHPDISSLDPSIHETLVVLTAWGNGDDARALSAVDILKHSSEENLRQLGERLAVTIKNPMVGKQISIDPLAPSRFGPIPTNAVQLWSEPLENSIYSRLQESLESGVPMNNVEGSAASGRFLVSIPTIDGPIVLVNEAYVLRAFDAFSHLPKWRQAIGNANAPRTDTQAGDLEVAVVATDCVLALSGHALGTERSGGGRLVCLDLLTGRKRWELAPDRFAGQSEFREFFFYGAPTVVHNTVVLLGRKMTGRLETVSTVVGVNLHSGEVEWITPVGAAPGIRSVSSRPYTTPTTLGGKVFVSTGAGTSACIEASDGRIRWIRRDPVSIRDIQVEAMPWEMGGAVVTTSGLLTIAPSATELQLLSIDTGEVIDSFPIGIATKWGAIRYLLTDRERSLVYGIGDGLTAFKVSDLRTPIWKFPIIPAENSAISRSDRAGIRGRVQSGWMENGRPGLIVPMGPNALLINGDDGTTVHSIPCEGPANIVARDGVIAAATNDSLQVLMDAARAKEILLTASNERPQDADAIIGLVEFALRARDSDLLRIATKSIEPAIEATRQNAQRRSRFVSILIDAARSGLLGRDGSDTLFAAIVRAHPNPAERAMALVAQGDWLAGSGRSSGAIAVWRMLLADSDASAVMISDFDSNAQSSVRSGSAAALQRLDRMASMAGGPAEAKQASENAPSNASPSELERFAGRMPCTVDAARAWIQAAQFRMNENEIAIAAGDSSAAVDAAIATANRVVVTEILNQAVELMKKSDLEITAAQLLDRSVMAGFDVPITSLGGLDASRALLASPAAPLVENLPRSVAATKVITASAEVTARLIPGVLAPLRDNGTSLAPNTRTYLLADRILSCFAIPDLGLRWAIPLPAEMLRVTPIRDGVLVIDQPTRDTRGAQKIDDAGEVRWRIDDFSIAVSETGVAGDRPECLVITGHENVVAVRVDGALGAFALGDGHPRWRSTTTVDEIGCVDASETLVVVAGTRVNSNARTSWIVAMDQATGKTIAELPVPGDEQVFWVTVMGPGEIAFGTSQSIGRWQIFGTATGLRWISTSGKLRSTVAGEMLGWKLLVSTATDQSNILDWRSGLIEDARFESSSKSVKEDGPRRWIRSGFNIVGWSRSVIDLFTLDGELVGSSSLHGARRIQDVLLASGAIVAVEQTTGVNEPRDFALARAGTRTLIHRFGWNDGGRIMGSALEVDFADGRLDRIQMLDGWILMGGAQSTLAIPLP
jgi:outer membrane protein assembly factor BamB